MNYKDSGVDIHEQDVFNAKLCNKMPWLGGFAGAFDIGENYLVSATDGVGTKTMLYNDYKHVKGVEIANLGIDLVAAVLNDIVCTGSKPLFFHDYISLTSMDEVDAMGIVNGINTGLKMCGTSVPIIGGETAIMNNLYRHDDGFDIAGFAVGIIPKDLFIDGSKIEDGDVMLGLASSGFHTNGYTLIRKVLEGHEARGELTDDLIKKIIAPSKIYVKTIGRLLQKHKDSVHGISHITGSGRANVNRLMGESMNLRPIWHNNEPQSEIFEFIQKHGDIDDFEMRKVFNNGIGMVLMVARSDAYEIQRSLESFGEKVYEVGAIGQRVEGGYKPS